MVGNLPQHGGTTTIRAPIIPVSVDLLAADGSVRFHVDANQYLQQALNPPIFQNAPYSSSSTPTQFNDAIQRAEFASTAKACRLSVAVGQESGILRDQADRMTRLWSDLGGATSR